MNHPSGISRRAFVAASAGTLMAPASAAGAPAPAPLFRDPMFDGASDPVIIWNRKEMNWWLLYTQRRANVDTPGVAWVHGCDVGVARSADNGRSWRYLGALPGLEFERGRNTFWAPEIVWHEGVYHMYCSYVPGVPLDWNERRFILHYSSPDLWMWRFEGKVPLSSEKVIDACVERLPGGQWRMWYKDEAHGSHTWAADSPDLNRWSVIGEIIGGRGHEGPNVFQWRGAWWMIIDDWNGLGVLHSRDGESWMRQAENILREPGKRRDDTAKGGHADVLIQGDDAWIFYFVHPQRGPGMQTPPSSVPGVQPYATRRSSIQVARLELEDGEIRCRRDEPVPFLLKAGVDNWGA